MNQLCLNLPGSPLIITTILLGLVSLPGLVNNVLASTLIRSNKVRPF